MATRLLVGDDGANLLQGGSESDLIYGFNPQGPQAQITGITANRVATGLDQPLFATAPPGDASRLFIVGKTGRIDILDLSTGQILPQAFLNLSAEIAAPGEQGLLGLAFHPAFARNGLFYVTLNNVNGDTEIRRYQAAPSANQADPASAQLVLAVDQPDGLTNHKGGWLGFGPDGFLYAGLGDGGGGGDPFNNAQNTNSLLGKILRLDVNADAFPADPARNYAIPADNPFASGGGAAEVWAYGLRNPWRASFDRGLGDFFIADVGQNAWEEIDLGAPGANYGWRVLEGLEPFAPGPLTGGAAIPPIHVYGHASGTSITGGYVYRGESEGLHGQYFFADFGSARVWTLQNNGVSWLATERTRQIVTDAGSIDQPTSFGEDARGNLYLTDFDGDVFRLTPQTISNDLGDQLLGGGGNDLTFGGSGVDWLLGESGNDTLVGGRGADVFVFAPGGGTDLVSDFNGAEGDLVLMTGGLTHVLSEQLGGTLATFSDGSSVLLAGLPPDQVSPGWFVAG
ncbi:PQQ-dependent sugar dehydrogenase [Azospirillum soli]|uniref:PQQ-dependent sugar dehydrogenase n=1 Tax=Azospirillum soli TaxID=1304799 RepID=UPI001AE300F6|nr:PQQ-dependent sugar dehydrogenase [Azospirillum soli]MBP2311619.1 glucose/arabinose dehydrogenase [Azospirillum soli]